jgi:predicted RNase H-like HicB family nuclease
MRQIVLYTDEDGVWSAMCPSLPGCFSSGKTKEEVIINIREAIALWIEDAQAHGEPVPSERFDAVIMVIEETPAVVK